MKKITAVTVMTVICLTLVPSAWAVGTTAGTRIVNEARADYTVGTSPTITAYSGTVGVTVAELVDAVVAWADASTVNVLGPLPTYGVDMVFSVSNLGNGNEDWVISVDNQVLGDDFQPDASPSSPLIYRDNGDATCDTATDTLIAVPEPIQADSVIYFCVYNDFSDTSAATGPADGEVAWVSLTATSTHAAGASVQLGAGDGGGDLVLAASGGVGSDTGTYQVVLTVLNMIKSYAVADTVSSTGTEPIPGAVITYTIEISVQGSGTALGVVVTDPFPANTSPVSGSLVVVPAPVGSAEGATNVTINFGDLTSGAGTQTITFDVIID